MAGGHEETRDARKRDESDANDDVTAQSILLSQDPVSVKVVVASCHASTPLVRRLPGSSVWG